VRILSLPPALHRPLVAGLTALLLSAGAPASASPGGSLTGTVRTSDGRTLPHVAVTVEGPSGSVRVTTGPEGAYLVDDLDPGEYTTSVDAPGLVLEGAARAMVGDGHDVRLDLVLSPAPVREQVLVTAARGEATHSNLGVSTNVLDRERIEDRAAPSLCSSGAERPATPRCWSTASR
jgi:hypothetical protein